MKGSSTDSKSTKAIVAAILLLCFVNVGWSLKTAFHTSLFSPYDYSAKLASLEHAKRILTSMGLKHAGYLPMDAATESGIEYFRIQNFIAPIVLRRDYKSDSIILVNTKNSAGSADVPGFEMFEDLGNDLALFRKR